MNLNQILSQLKKFKDTRVLVLLGFGVVVLMVTWSGVKAVEANFQLQKQISRLEQQNQIQKLQNKNLKLQNDYYDSAQYQELSARQNLGLAKPGEKEIIVPKNVALSYTKDLSHKTDTKAETRHEPFYEKNLKAWWNFFLGRQA